MASVYVHAALVCLVICFNIHPYLCNQPPVFVNDLSRTYVPEDTALFTIIGKVVARDPDNGYDINYQIDSSYFSINKRTGDVTLISSLNYEVRTSITATLKINSVDDSHQIVERQILILVRDVNDVAPVFIPASYSGSMKEDDTVNTVVFKGILATDVDTVSSGLEVDCDTAVVSQQFAGVCDRFGIRRTINRQYQRWEGEVYLKQTVTYKEKTVWQIPLKATDGVHTTHTSIEISVQDIQNEPPIFLSSMSVVMTEGEDDGGPGTTVIRVQARDQDVGVQRQISYHLKTNPGGLFIIFNPCPPTALSGYLGLAKQLDRDVDPVLVDGFVNVELLAMEIESISGTTCVLANNSYSQATATLIVTVMGINDKAPLFDKNNIVVRMPEDVPENSPVPNLSLTVTDQDQDPNATFALRLLTYSDVFSVHPTNGKEVATLGLIVKNSAKIDYDAGNRTYVVLIEAYETESPLSTRKATTSTVTIMIDDVNDLRPSFPQTQYSFSLSEKSPGGYYVNPGVAATDGDSGNFGTAGIRYQLVGNGAEKFLVDAVTGRVTLVSCSTPGVPPCFDRETNPVYTVSLVAIDNLGTGNSNSTVLIITFTDENDNAPVFPINNYEFYITEGQTSGDPLIQVQANDADSALNGNNVIQYSLINGTTFGGLWRIGSGGIVIATSPVDYETTLKGEYLLYVMATDSATPFYSAVVTIKIYVIDINDHAPRFSIPSPLTLNVYETTKGNTFLYDLTATDGDLITSPNGMISYSIRSGAQDKFSINVNNGSVYTSEAAVFDFDVQPSFVLIIVATDRGSPALKAEMRVVINVIDTNNKLPIFLENPKRVSIKEDEVVGSFVTLMSAKDSDVSAKLNYTILSVEYKNKGGVVISHNETFFDLDSTNANVTVRSRMNRDVVAEVSMTVHVSDVNASTVQTAVASLIVVILDVNDRPPTFTLPWTASSPYLNLTVEEEQSLGSYLTIITASDPDGPISEYRISNDPNSLFAISYSGAVTLRSRLDFESLQTTNFTVLAVDSGSPPITATATIRVTVKNINDNSPVFSQSEYHFNVTESFGPPSTSPNPVRFLGFVNASDSDLESFGQISFSLLDSSGKFSLTTSSKGAEIFTTTTAHLDRETSSDIVLNIQASDSPDNSAVRRFVSTPVYIRLVDLNDNAPYFSVTRYFSTVGNNAPIGTYLVTISALDADLKTVFTYSLIPSTESGLFHLNSTTGILTTAKSISDKSGNILLTGSVSDGTFSATVSIQLSILESSREAPRWIYPSAQNSTISVLEEQYKGLVITTIVALGDNSSGSSPRLTYGIIQSNTFVSETNEFAINPVTGVLSARAIFDRESISKYTLLLAVRDDRAPPLESRRYINIDILDIDDNPPAFSLSFYSLAVTEGIAFNTSIGAVAAVDKDSGANANIYYSILSGNTGNSFYLHPVTGVLYTSPTAVIDREATGMFSLQVQASNTMPASGKRKKRQTTASNVVVVNITVGDLNDNPPMFQYETYNVCISSEIMLNQAVYTVKAIDPDYGDSAIIQYGIVDSFNLFRIDSEGEIVLKNLLPVFNNDPLIATVSAWNPGLESNKSTTMLRVWVVSPSNTIKMTVTQSPIWIQQHLTLYKAELSRSLTSDNVCLDKVRYHQDKNGNVDPNKADILIAAVGKDGKLIPSNELAASVRAGMQSNSQKENYNWLGAKSAVSYEEESDSPDYTLIVIIAFVILGLILLACIIYVIVVYFMSKRLNEKCQKNADVNAGLAVLTIKGVHRKNLAYADSAVNG